VDCLRLRTTRGKESIATNKLGLPAGVSLSGWLGPPTRSIPGIAREIGVSDGTLRNWVNQEEIDSGQREGLTTQEKEELRRLRREVKTLRQEKEISRKAAVGSTDERNGLSQCSSRCVVA
jgi:transposase